VNVEIKNTVMRQSPALSARNVNALVLIGGRSDAIVRTAIAKLKTTKDMSQTMTVPAIFPWSKNVS